MLLKFLPESYQNCIIAPATGAVVYTTLNINYPKMIEDFSHLSVFKEPVVNSHSELWLW